MILLSLVEETNKVISLIVGLKKKNVFGPLPKGTFGLILGCSSAALRGPGVIDSDYVGEILIMVSTSTTLSLLAGEHIAQMLLLPYHPFLAFPNERTGGFGSTG